MITRRNTLTHTVAAACGDIATGVAVAAACVWLIETAILGFQQRWDIDTVFEHAATQY